MSGLLRVTILALALLTLGIVALALLAEDAEATHYRGGTMYGTPNATNFLIEGRMSYKTSYTGWSPPCAPGVLAPTTFSTPSISIHTGSPTGPVIATLPFRLKVMSCNGPSDWFVAKIVTPVTEADGVFLTVPAANQGQTLYATWNSGNRISNAAPNFHVNNPDSGWRLETELVPGNNPPRPFVPPVVQCPTAGFCSIPIPFADNDFNDTHDLRWATPTETGDLSFLQPGPCGACGSAPAATLYDGGSTNFRLNWTSTGSNVLGPCQTVYSTQVMINDTVAKVPMEWLIRLCDGIPPYWVTPPSPCSQTLSTVQGATISFNVRAASNVSGNTVTISALEYPTGATIVTSSGYTMPGNPTQVTFSWNTMGRPLGEYLAVFYAEDNLGLTAQTCSVNIRLLPPPILDFTFEFRNTGSQVAGYPGPYNLTYDDVDFYDNSDITCYNYLTPCGIPVPAVSWTWDHNDPYDTSPGYTMSPSHVYSVATNSGTIYPTCMTATVQYSFQWSGTVCKDVEVFNRPPAPQPRPTVSAGGQVVFNDFGGDIDGSVQSYFWEFGDGSTQYIYPGGGGGGGGSGGGYGMGGGRIGHRYAADGVYTVCLTIVDNAGSTNRSCVQVRVKIPLTWMDVDLDGVSDVADNCPSTSNHDQADHDGDSMGDACDSDLPPSDDDPVPPVPPADLQATDFDLDGHADEQDNCPYDPNRDQDDLDGDTRGDFCDFDLDGDGHDQWADPGMNGALDNCPTVPNPDQLDADGNGVGDACEGPAFEDRSVSDGAKASAERGESDDASQGLEAQLFGAKPELGMIALVSAIVVLVVLAVGTSVWAVRRWGKD